MKTSTPDKRGGISSEAVNKATGKTWAQWYKLLDKAGCREMTHTEIARLVGRKFDAGMWWSQMVAVGYEQARGLRVRNQKCDGDFQVSVNKTIDVPVADAYKAWADERRRAGWMDGAEFVVTTTTPNKSFRMKWAKDDSRAGVLFWNKGPRKTQVSVHHEKLKDAAAVERTRKYWGRRLAALKQALEA